MSEYLSWNKNYKATLKFTKKFNEDETMMILNKKPYEELSEKI